MSKSRYNFDLAGSTFLRATMDLVDFLDCDSNGFTYSCGLNGGRNCLIITIEKL